MSFKIVFELGENRLANPEFTVTNFITDDGKKIIKVAALFKDLGVVLPDFLIFEGELVAPPLPAPAEPTAVEPPAPEVANEVAVI